MVNMPKSNWKYQTLLDNIPGGVLQCLNDELFTILEVNHNFLEMFGFTRLELTQRFNNHFMEIIHPDDRCKFGGNVYGTMSHNGNRFSIDYRAICKDGSYRWIMDNGQLIYDESGEERLLCILLDVTESREHREQLRLSLERHEIIMDQIADIIFEWNFANDSLVFSHEWSEKFGYNLQYTGHLLDKSLFRYIHPKDASLLSRTMTAIKNGSATSVELRVLSADGRYIWCRVRSTTQFDENECPIKAVGIISDIDDDKRILDDLRQRAEHDALTGLCNREETERRIVQHLESEPEGVCALFIVDIDNFKLVNDSRGHLFGDAVLSELAAGIKKLAGTRNIAGRIGGDEFAVFLVDIPGVKAAEERAKALVAMFHNLFCEEKEQPHVTCSIGVSLFPFNGKSFQGLYSCADLALYQAKSQGKNRFVFYDPDKAPPVYKNSFSALGAAIDSDLHTANISNDLVSYVFKILYDTDDVDYAIHLILEIVGKRFDVSRAYIFETNNEEGYASNTYEWCNEGISPEKQNMQHIPIETINSYINHFKDNTIFYCHDIRSLRADDRAFAEQQGVRSLLHCAIVNQGVNQGFVGFDECTGTRMWTKDEVAVISLISQLITTFLLKQRATEHDAQLTLRLNTILDSMDAYIYAVRPNDHKLVYLNEKTKILDPCIELGSICYQTFFSKDAPCENCPITNATNEVFYPKYGVWTKVCVSQMKWVDEDIYLLSCFDITEYKQTQNPENPSE